MTFYAKGPLAAPGTLVPGYQRGDEVHPSVVESWGLIVGEHVSDGPLNAEAEASPIGRPAPEATRAQWEAWAVANGMSEKDAAEASQEELEAAGPEETEPYARPADSAKKSDWVAYVSGHPQAGDGDKAWAREDSTTKTELQAWQPAGDPVALAATEQANG